MATTAKATKSVLLAHKLALAEHHVVQGERLIAEQREVLARLEKAGHDGTRAREILSAFETSQRLHISDRDRLRTELDMATTTTVVPPS